MRLLDRLYTNLDAAIGWGLAVRIKMIVKRLQPIT
jgi:hypothetical protein